MVSSRPRPAPGPGRKRVPRCRTRIIPARTVWPSKIFTPSRFASESRPLREEPMPFLCAIRGLRLLRLRLRRRPLRDLLDLDLRKLAPVAGVAPVAGLRAVLPDPYLLAEHVLDDA